MTIFFQKLIRWMPLFLLVFLFLIDRDNTLHTVIYIFFLLSYSAILILKILYAKEEWHRDFDTDSLSQNSSLEKMDDYQNQLIKKK